ncbi:ATP-binding protein [Variovorax sp. dw_308]|uniref:ATP-binding protein n=1 Tax=Variovorax sp. dw_308 TaxID=2721546 RepID=UPI0035270CD1
MGSALNRRFADWGEVFPNAACVVSLVDRLMHRAEVVRIEGDSYRQKEAEEHAAQRAAARRTAAGTRAASTRTPRA